MAKRLADPRPRTRDDGLRRLRRLTIAASAAAATLTGVFAGIGAASFPGRHLAHAIAHTRKPAHARRTEVPAPTPPLPASSSSEVPAPPSAPPVASGSPPVVVSGGS